MFTKMGSQKQKAGDNSTQLSVGNMTVYQGITEERARAIFREMNEVARQSYTQDALEIAIKRVNMFETVLMDKVEKVDGMLEAFADPGFQFLLRDAQIKAAASERETDYALLSELLVSRFQKGENRKHRAGISHAVKVVDEIDDDALCALTVLGALERLVPKSGRVEKGLDVMEDLCSTLLFTELPDDQLWQDHLDILNLIRINSLSSLKRLEDYFSERWNGYVCVGIKKDSEQHRQALEIWYKINAFTNVLVDNKLLDGYVCIPVRSFEEIDNTSITNVDGQSIRETSLAEREAMKRIWGLYSHDEALKNDVKRRFVEEIDKRPSLKKVRQWWNSIPNAITLTQAGAILARANAQHYNRNVPDWDAL